MNKPNIISNGGTPQRRHKSKFSGWLVPAILCLLNLQSIDAGSATWNLDPVSGDWNTATNWMPNTVPNGPADIATFGVSNTTSVSLSASAEVESIIFSPGASAFTIAPQPGFRLTISGTGIVNDSGSTQNLMTTFALQGSTVLQGIIEFTGASTAGDQVVVTNQGSSLFGRGGAITLFTGTANAGNATFLNQGGSVESAGGGEIIFEDSSSAGNGIFINSDDAVAGAGHGNIALGGASTAANGTFINEPGGGFIGLGGNGGNATFLCKGNSVSGVESGQIQISGPAANAGHATFTIEGGQASGAAGGYAQFGQQASGGDSTFILNGGAVEGALGASLGFQVGTFGDRPTAGNATLVANGGSNGGEGSTILFVESSLGISSGGNARVEVFGNGSLDISSHSSHTLTIGSLEGDGRVFLGSAQLSTGKRMSTTFSGTIADGGIVNGTGGSLTKVGRETFELSGANTYTGGTTVSAGALIVSNPSGSGTGAGTVSINAGTLGGSGIISGAVTVGTGSGGGAFLAPAFGSSKQITLTLRSSLTLQADATYTYTFKARTNQTRSDLVRANGVTINGATIALQGQTQGTLKPGTELTVIRNTSANPISGTFSNLANGAIVTVDGNNLQASYTGGDGNDLTLTVVP